MRIAIALALSLAACGRLGFGTDEPVAGDDAAVDAAACVAPIGDNDDDADGVADTCDTCPHVAGPQFDGDGDGVGDPCDPRATPTETIQQFVPFLAPISWSSDPDAWYTVQNSALVGTALSSYGWVGYIDDPTGAEIVMRGRIDEVGAGPYQLSIQFALSMADGAEYCEVYSTPVPTLKITRGIPPDMYESLAETPVPALAPGPFTMRYGHSVDGLRCSLAIGGTTYEIASSQSFSVPRDFIALQFIDLDVFVESFAHIETTP